MADVDLFSETAVAPEGHAASGLASDYWWRDCTLATANRCREWVREQLLQDPHMTGHDADRFIASLSPGKRENLIRRAVNGHGPRGF